MSATVKKRLKEQNQQKIVSLITYLSRFWKAEMVLYASSTTVSINTQNARRDFRFSIHFHAITVLIRCTRVTYQ